MTDQATILSLNSKSEEVVDEDVSTNDKDMVYSMRVSFMKKSGESVTLTAVYQDTLPSGSKIGTVVTLHGSPGSHNDFKYVSPHLMAAGIRVIGVNYPGFGLTEDAPSLQFDNVERNNFVEAVLDALSLNENVIFMGHSRGTENALMLTVAHAKLSSGVVLVNPTGFRAHRSCWPVIQFTWYSRIYDLLPFFRPVMERVFKFLYNKLGLRVTNGRVAIVGVKTMSHLALHRQRAYMDNLTEDNMHHRMLIAYSGEDWLIERSISEEFVRRIEHRHHLECLTNEQSEEEEVTQNMEKAYKEGHRIVTAYFATDNHFLQKHRAVFLAKSVLAMLKTGIERARED